MAKCSITNCTDLKNCLNQAVQGPQGSQFIELSAELFDAAGQLASYLGLTSLTVHQIDAQTPLIQDRAPCAWIVGKGSIFAAVAEGGAPLEYNIQISASVSGSSVKLVLEATPLAPDTWTFAANFPAFPKYFGSVNLGLTWLPSFYDGWSLSTPVFWAATQPQDSHPAGLSFTATVDLTKGSLAEIGPYFPAANQVPLSGIITVRPNTFPLLDLTGDLSSYSIDKLADVSLAFRTKDAALKDPAESVLLLVGITSISASLPSIRLSAPLLQGNYAWVITGEVEDKEKYPLGSLLPMLVSYANNSALPLPSGMDTGGLYLDGVTVSVRPGLPPSIEMVGFRIASTPGKVWSAPILGLGISDLFVQWEVVSPFRKPSLVGAVGGKLYLGSGDAAPRLNMQVGLSGISTQTAPDVEITAQLDPEYPVSIGALFQQLTGIDLGLNLHLSQMMFIGKTGPRTLQFTATIDGEWPFPVEFIKFGTTNFFFLYTPNSVTGSVSVRVSISTFDFLVSAAYAGKGQGWTFAGELAPDSQGSTLQNFVDGIAPGKYPSLPGNLGAITLRKFAVSFNTQTQAFSFAAALEWPFQFDDYFNLTLGADLAIQSPGPSPTGRKYSGSVGGKLTINAFSVAVVYTFTVENNSTLTFVLRYNQLSLSCAFSRAPKTNDRILTVNLGGVTFGGILEYLVNLVDPNLGFRLSTPWDVLNQISFDNLALTANLTRKTVGVTYKVGKNLGLIEIDTIGLAYVDRAGRKTVDITITGRFFDQEYKKENPLSWDLLNDPPPTPPGKGEQLIDLRYFGMGQNVAFRSTRSFTKVQDVITAMQADFLPADAPDSNPLQSPALDKLKFSGNGNWLIGADFTLIGAISLSVVFNDPILYGLRVALSGEKVKSFSGLDFQILYRKVTDTIGVYHIELTLPQAFRQLQFGAVAVTLPIITIDIYTNGNFRVDLGFPVGLDFSRSFCVQAGPFIGYGGFYFAVLDGATSDRVPKITNGTFSPVIEVGLGLSVGLGRTFDKGVLSAGITITVQAIVQGSFGWFNPNNRTAKTDLYYWIQGTAAIVGKLYGVVNFFIVQAEVHVTAYASVTLTVEAYKAIEIELKVGVEVSVSVKILFIRVSFSFKTELHFPFTIGSSSPTPWTVDSSQPPRLTLRQQYDLLGNRRLSGARLQSLLLASAGTTGTFDWTPRKVFASTQGIALSLVPTLTVALPQTIYATRQLTGPLDPRLQIVATLFAENSVSTNARRAADVRAVEHPQAQTTAFNLLVEGMLRWALSSYTRQPGAGAPVTLASDLEAIGDYLASSDHWQTVFTYDAVAAMMELNYKLNISTPFTASGVMHPNGMLLGPGVDAPEISSTVFPMIPELAMAPAGVAPVTFWNYGCITREYEDALGEYYAQLRVAGGNNGSRVSAKTNFRTEAGPVGCTNGESLSTFVFRDYFAMITKEAVQSASSMMKAYPYEPTGSLGPTAPTGPSAPTGPLGPTESLESIASAFSGMTFEYVSQPGDTIGKLAARFGVHPNALALRNPHLAAHHHRSALPAGTPLAVEAAVTPAALAEANSGYPLHYIPGTPVRMPVSGANHQVKGATGGASQSLNQICIEFGIDDAASIFTFETDTVPPENPNVNNRNLLRAGTTMSIPAHTFQVLSPVDDIPALVAAFFFVRSIGPSQPGQTPWYDYVRFYEQWILQNNKSLTGPTWGVPVVTVEDGSLKVTGSQVYAPQGATGGPLSPDTTNLVAGYFAMTQLQPEPFTEAFQQFERLVSATGPSGTYYIADSSYAVQAGDTVESISTTLGVPVDSLVNANAGRFGLLQNLSVLALPTLPYAISEGDTLLSVADRFDLTLEELAESVKKTSGILQPYSLESGYFTIPDVPARNTDLLLSDLVRFGRFNDIAGMVTRFLLHGMRVPKPGTEAGTPFPPETPLYSLYEMDGQQFPVPQGPSGPVGAIDIVFSKGSTASWICFSATAPTGPTGPTAPSECLDALTVHLGNEFFTNPPAGTLHPEILAGPGPLPLYRDDLRTYPFQQTIHWQTTANPYLPGPTAQPIAGQPSLWLFPPALQAIALQGPTGATGAVPYRLLSTSTGQPTSDNDTAVPHYAWAGAIDIRIQRIAGGGSTDQSTANSYLLLGADQDGRDQLLAAWTLLERLPAPAATLSILYSPSATSDNSKGLASDAIDPERTFLLKTNLTTVTQSNPGALGDPSGAYYARLSAAPEFLKLAWEASVTGSGGYYLNYVNQESGAGLPDVLFASGDTVTITLLVLADFQVSPYGPDRGLYPFNNCAVVGDNIDAGAVRLYARSQHPSAEDIVRVGTVEPGNAGFYLARLNPDPSATGPGPTGPDDQTRLLFNLTGFQLAENGFFRVSNQGLPAGPADTPVLGVSGPTGPEVWWYQQVLPVHKFGKVNQTPACPALPAQADNPYAGIQRVAPGPTGLSYAAVDFAFHDIYGNTTESDVAGLSVNVPVGYTDELIGLSAWPGIGADFEFRPGPDSSRVTLNAALSMQTDRYLPSGSYGFDQSSVAAEADAKRYAQAFYQVQQTDLTVSLDTNLGASTLAADSLKASVTAFVSKAAIFTAAAKSLRQQSYTTQQGDQLAAIAAAYNVALDALADQNATVPLASLFAGAIVRPQFAIAGPMNTLELLAANVTQMPYPPSCDGAGSPCPDGIASVRATGPGAVPPQAVSLTDGAAITPEQLAANNLRAPLNPGIDLRTDVRTSLLPAGVANTLATVAAALNCSVYAVVIDPDNGDNIEIGLYAENYDAGNVVAPNLEIEIDGVKVSTGSAPTFQSVENSFSSLGLDTGDFVQKLQTVEGIFAASAKLSYADFVVPQPPATANGTPTPVFSLADLPAGTGGVDVVARLNRNVTTFYFAGTPVYQQYCCYAPAPFDTFQSLAAKFGGLTVAQLVQFNATGLLKAGASLAIPNLTYLGNAAATYSGYSPLVADSLNSIASAYGTTPTAIGAINRYLPGIFGDGVTITIGGTTLPAGALDSLNSMAIRFQIGLNTFLGAIVDTAGLFRPGGVIVAPLPKTGDGVDLQTLAVRYNTSAADILRVNRSLEGFLRNGGSVIGPQGTQPVAVGPHDTIDTVIRTFEVRQQATVTVEQLAQANAGVPSLLTPRVSFLLPPAPTAVNSTVNPSIPPGGGTCESQIVFPVTVSATLRRSQDLVSPDFSSTPAVYENTSRLSPRGFVSGADDPVLVSFARSFETAFAAYGLKAAVSRRDTVSDPQKPGELMAVNFGAQGVSQFRVASESPQFYSLPPLSTSLMSGVLPVREYRSGCGLCTTVYKSFDSVDLDGWMAQFLSAIDLFLSTPYAVPAFQMGRVGEVAKPAEGPLGAAALDAKAGLIVSEMLGGCEGCTGATAADGPTNFDNIVASKLSIAGYLSDRISPILEVAGPTAGYYATTARDTLYQQMLVRLGDAYSVNAVVQYPVDVQSPCVTPYPAGPTAPVPPRVSGNLTPELYVVPKGPEVDAGTLQGAAGYFGVCAPFLAESIADARGILEKNAAVDYQGGQYRISAEDTLHSVAAHFGVPVDPDQMGYWQAWTGFITAIANQVILVMGGSIPATRIARQVHPLDSLGDIANYFGIDVVTVGEANQERKGICKVGAVISVPGYQPYTVQAGDSLLSIAAAIQPAGLTVAALSEFLSNDHNVLTTGQTLYLTQALADITLSTSKVSLGRVGSTNGTDPALSFLFSVKHPRRYKSLFLNLKYVINELEFAIRNAAGTSGYQASNWLTFLIPIGSGQGSDAGVETAIQQVQIPIPLRAYPVPPTVVAQSGLPTQHAEPPVNPAQAIAMGKQWDYRLDFQSQNAAQDSDHVEVTFRHRSSATALAVRAQAVFQALAEFIDAYPRLIADLAILPTLQPGQSNATAAIAAQVLDVFAASVSTALGLAPDLLGAGDVDPDLRYGLRTTSASGELKDLTLQVEIGPTGPAAVWPRVFVQSLTAPTGGTGPDAGFLELTEFSTSTASAEYRYPTGFPEGAMLTQRFLFSGRDVIQNPGASGGVYITRNDALIASLPLGTTGATGPVGDAPTNQAFVYQTPVVSFIDPLTPFLVDDSRIDVSGLTGPTGPTGPKPLAQHIVNLLSAVLEIGPQPNPWPATLVSVQCSYGFGVTAADGPAGLIATTPILLVPTQRIAPDNLAAFAAQLAASIAQWPGWPGNPATGALIFDVSVYAAVGGATGPAAPLKPVLEFENLRVPISQIVS